MKNFNREYTAFALCGLNCGLCPMYHMEKPCPGCGGGAGNQSCAIAKCSLTHGDVQFCWECPEYPCSRYDGFDDGDSFVPHRNRQQDIARAQELGLDAKVMEGGWRSLTAKESGKIGGLITKRKRELKKEALQQE